uniref:Ribonuclease A-domain domain-containing protein n=1 Tax=Fundulus heteroclitus TaxID=8078 RepID=A0A3Q2PSU0_FUNHE
MKTQAVFSLLVLLSVAWLSQAAERLLLVGPMEPKDCTAKMKEMVNAGNQNCAPTKTFIVSTQAEVDPLCKGIEGNMKKPADKIFKVVDCNHDRKSNFPDCKYSGNAHTKTKLYLECEPEIQGRTVLYFKGCITDLDVVTGIQW